MNVLLSAYSCEPNRGSEPGLGWSVAREMARHHSVWVLTRPDESRAAIAAELERNPVPNLHFVYFTLPFWQDSLRWGQSGAMQLHYYLWQIQAYLVARRLHQDIGFDICHHVTFNRYATPSFLSLLPIPFVWGPVGGGESAPLPFWKDFSTKAKLYETARALFRWLGERDPFVRLTVRNSAAIFAGTDDTAQRLYHLGATDVKVMAEACLYLEEIDRLAQTPTPPAQPVRFISMGRLLHWKGFYLGIQAFAQAGLQDAEYWVVGEGSELERLQRLTENLGVADQVRFWGRLSRSETLARLAEAHVLVHPSLHDSGGWVLREAMAVGRPIVCLNLGGPGVQVTNDTGIKVSANNPEQAIQELVVAMKRLARDPELRQQMGLEGQQLVRRAYSWEKRERLFSELYEKLAKSEAAKSSLNSKNASATS
ncbi:MAG: glycosyltransferase family 4 protein [Leptolyngbyaceae cyanobacterium bins.302]|nr:glycosyltransferase family 4 protein [Leptolyngbyaceae cyanobacterium bins.302]